MGKHEAQTFTFSVSSKYNDDEKQAIAEEVLTKITNRTLRGIDKKSRPFKSLSKDYKAFKRKAVGSGKANLKFSGEMLGALKYVDMGDSSITVGYESGDEQNAKAKGHITGDIGAKRDFLGLPKREIRDITRKFPIRDKEKREASLGAAIKLREKLRGKKD
jgi:hypothetical protein